MRARVKNVLNYKRPAFWVVCAAVVVAVAAGVCLISNPGPDAGHAVQKKASEIKNSEVPNFEELYANTVEIDVNFDPDGLYGGHKTIKIKDGKIISDIMTMIGESHAIKDDSQINNMSGMATRNNSLTLVAKDGSRRVIKFAFDDPAFAVGYLEIDDKKYDPGFTFFRYIADFAEYKQFDTRIDGKVEELFGKYNWTVDYRVTSSNMKLPTNLKHEAGEYPVKIYWAYNNELSKNIGLDYSGYLGKEVQVDIYRLREPLPEYLSPRMNSRGIVLKYDDKIVGAYIDSGRHNSFACSLDRKSLKDITGKEWDSWIGEHINYNNELEIKLSKMKPEDVIRQYYAAMDSQDQKMLFACMTRQNLCDYLAVNMDNNQLINEGFKNAYIDGEQNVKSAKLIGLREMSVAGNSKNIVEYEVTIDYEFYKELTSSSGTQPRFVILRKESDKSGWRIQSEGTGP